jgi:hypothetical protein
MGGSIRNLKTDKKIKEQILLFTLLLKGEFLFNGEKYL